MPGPSPDVNYNPVPTVEPNVQAPNDYLSVRADPSSFGAQVGQAKIQQGQIEDKISGDATDIAIQRQGMLNETMATNADTQLAAAHGSIVGKYKSLEGLQAVSQTDNTVQQLQQARLQIRATLPNAAAQRAFDLFSARREAYSIGDINNYSATQLKSADTKSATDALQTTIDQASSPSLAFNNSQIDFGVGEIKSQLPRILTNLGYGMDAGTGMKQDANGDLSFDDSTAGQQAKAVADQYTSKALGQYYDNIATTIATDPQKGNIANAVKFLEDHKSEIPAETYSRLSAKFSGPYKAEQARTIVDSQFTTAMNNYAQPSSSQNTSPLGTAPASTITTLFPGAVVTSQGRTPEHNTEVGGVPDSMHLSNQAIDFVLPQGMTFSQVQSTLASKGIKPTELLDEGSHIHLGWAPKNGQTSSTGYISPIDQLDMHESDLIQGARDGAKNQGFDVDVQDLAAQRMETRINEARSAQQGEIRYYQDSVISKVMDSKNPITNMSLLDHSADPELSKNWINFQALAPLQANTVRSLVRANAEGVNASYGTDFSNHLFQVLQQKEDPDTLGDYIGGTKAPISNSGYEALSKEKESLQTTTGQAFAQAELGFFQKMKNQLDPANDGVGNQKFNAFVQQVLPQIQGARDSNKSPGDIFDENNKADYIGKSANQFGRSDTQILNDSLKTGAPGESTTAPVKAPWSAPYDSIKNAESGNLALLNAAKAIKDPEANLAFRRQARQYAIKRGWAFEAPSPQSVIQSNDR